MELHLNDLQICTSFVLLMNFHLHKSSEKSTKQICIIMNNKCLRKEEDFYIRKSNIQECRSIKDKVEASRQSCVCWKTVFVLQRSKQNSKHGRKCGTHTHTQHMNHMRDDERDVSHQKEGADKNTEQKSGQTTRFRKQKQTNTIRFSCFSSQIQMFLSFLRSFLPVMSHVT